MLPTPLQLMVSNDCQWVRTKLVEEGLVVNKKKAKQLFTHHDLTRVLVTLWTEVDLGYIHERHRVQFTFIFRMYCWTGARIGAFLKGSLDIRYVAFCLNPAK